MHFLSHPAFLCDLGLMLCSHAVSVPLFFMCKISGIQLLVICHRLQSSQQPSLSFVNISFAPGRPELGRLLHVWSLWCCLKGNNHSPPSTGFFLAKVGGPWLHGQTTDCCSASPPGWDIHFENLLMVTQCSVYICARLYGVVFGLKHTYSL